MKNSQIDKAYNMEIVALIKSGVEPEEAKKIADSHVGNYTKLVKEVAEEDAKEKETARKQNAYARVLSARIKAGEKPEEVIEDMKDFEI